MLREDRNAGLVTGRMLLMLRRTHFAAGPRRTTTWGARRQARLMADQERTPVEMLHDDGRTWWLYRGRIYREEDDLAAEDVAALVAERERRKRRRLERAHDLLAVEEGQDGDTPAGRRGIPEAVRRAVYRRDGGRCVRCGDAELLQFDHIIPVALGGADGPENLQLLCASCNRDKGAAL